MAMLIPFAHFGHVLIDLPLFGGPVIFLALALMWSSRQERRRERGRRGAPPAPRAGPSARPR
ncbi:MAG: hypothetical protein E6G53_01440 [Actinobacteria bacterium]|nr:MAG: hypothetical protein E6G53_01440 [Actinomycetota bacterium]